MLLSKFLEHFLIRPEYKPSASRYYPWIFWSGSENRSSSADLDTRLNIIHEMIKSAFSNTATQYPKFLGQFWAPVTIRDKRLLSTSGQPFVVNRLFNDFALYRLYSEKFKYNIDVNKVDSEGDHPMIINGGPATAFLTGLPYMSQLEWFPSKSYEDDTRLNFSVMVPICLPSESCCIGVLEFTTDKLCNCLGNFLLKIITPVKQAGLDVFYVQDLIPYKTINGLKLAKDEIDEALKVVCESHNLALAQVWIAYEDKSRVLSSSSLEDSQTKRLLAIKLTGYLNAVTTPEFDDFDPYYRLCDVTPRGIREDLALETFQDYESRYIAKLGSNMLDWGDEFFSQSSALAICLRSNHTGDFNYAFEFIWIKHLNYVILLEALLLTLKRCLPRFKFASGAKLGDELDVIVVESVTDSEHGEDSEDGEDNEDDVTVEIDKFKIFQGKRSPTKPKALGERKNKMVYKSVSPLKVKHKTSPIDIPLKLIEEQFGNTMKEAAKNLNVSKSTLKRKWQVLRDVFGISEWPGPMSTKRKANDMSHIQVNTSKEYNGAIEKPSKENINKIIVTINAKYENDMAIFHLFMQQVTFVTIEKEICMKFKLKLGTYKLTYLDEDKDWISLRSDEDMSVCIESSRKPDGKVVVHLSVHILS